MSQGDRETVLNQLQDGGQRGEHSSLLGRLLLARRWGLRLDRKAAISGQLNKCRAIVACQRK